MALSIDLGQTGLTNYILTVILVGGKGIGGEGRGGLM